MLFTLRPLVLESQGLTAALHQLAEKVKETHGQNVIVEAEPNIDERLELNHQGVLFYIVEEAVNNARKHAQAEHIWVRLKSQSDVLRVEIQDDGVGFNVGAVDSNYDRRGSLGMVNMRERAEMIYGMVRLDSAEGRGTRVLVFVPLTEAARERMRS
jgi:signal transduction histidine kinase